MLRKSKQQRAAEARARGLIKERESMGELRFERLQIAAAPTTGRVSASAPALSSPPDAPGSSPLIPCRWTD